LGIAFYRRTYPKLARTRELLRAGVIGQPLLAYITCYGGWPGYEDYAPWRLDPALSGGGPLMDVGSHRIDVLNFLFGEPQRVTAHIANQVHPAGVEDSATVVIEYTGKVRGIVDVRWNTRAARDEFRIVGTDGDIDLTSLNGPRLVYPGGKEDIPTHANIHFPCVQNFVAAVLDGVPLLSSGSTALWTSWVIEQAIESAKA
jgi:predicted dehydrogenase